VRLEQIPEQTIRHVVRSVYGSSSYTGTTLLGRLWYWARTQFVSFLNWLLPRIYTLRQSPPLYWGALVLLSLLTAAVVARWVYLWRARTDAHAGGGAWMPGSGGAPGDAWRAAQQLAAHGDYTAAAHALYAALLEAGARQNQLRLHPSKTSGDYVREVRRRSSPIFPSLRDFARAYEIVIYGLGECDRDRYERLLSIARPIVTHG
jgi:hypothetical protein